MHQARDHGEQRSVAHLQPERVPHIGGIGLFAGPVTGTEAADEVRVALRLPAFVDAVEQAAEQTLAGLHAEETFHAATELRRGDLPGVGRAHGGDVIGIGDAGLEQRQLAVELHALRVAGLAGNAQLSPLGHVDIALIGEVVDGEHAGRRQSAPVHVRRCQTCRPVMGVDQLWRPADAGGAGGDLGSGQTEAGEADRVVQPVVAVSVDVG